MRPAFHPLLFAVALLGTACSRFACDEPEHGPLHPSVSASDRATGRARYGAELKRRLDETGVFQRVDFDEKAFTLTIEDGDGGFSTSWDLGEKYAAFENLTDDRREVSLQHFVAMAIDTRNLRPGVPFEEVADRLLPIIQDRYETELAGLREDPIVFPYRALNQDLGVVVGITSDASYGIVTQDRLDGWHKSFDEVYARAVRNQAGLPRPEFVRHADGVWRIDSGRATAPAFALEPASFGALKLRGPPLIAFPMEGALLVADSADPDGAAALVREAHDIRLVAPQIMDLPFLVTGAQKLDEYEPADPALRAQVDTSREGRLLGAYDVQAKRLEATRGLMVSSAYMMKRAGGSAASKALVFRGLPTLIPKTEYVEFRDMPGEDGGVREPVSWQIAEEVLGLHQAPGLYPPLYEVSDFPNDAQLAEMKRRSVTPR